MANAYSLLFDYCSYVSSRRDSITLPGSWEFVGSYLGSRDRASDAICKFHFWFMEDSRGKTNGLKVEYCMINDVSIIYEIYNYSIMRQDINTSLTHLYHCTKREDR